MITPWERSFGRENVKLLRYQGKVTSSLVVSEIVKKAVSLPQSHDYWLNARLSQDHLELIRIFNTMVPDWNELYRTEQLHLLPSISDARVRFISYVISTNCSARPVAEWSTTDETCYKISKLALDDREWLREREIVMDGNQQLKTNKKGSRGPDIFNVKQMLATSGLGWILSGIW